MKNPSGQKSVSKSTRRNLRRLVSEHYRVLYEFALESLRDEVAAQAVVVSVFLDGCLEGVEGASLRAARARLLNLAMARGLDQAQQSVEGDVKDIDTPPPAVHPTDLDVSAASNPTWIAECMAALPSRDRQLLYLAHGAAMSPLEIADLFACSVEQVAEQMAGVQERLLTQLRCKSQEGDGAQNVY